MTSMLPLGCKRPKPMRPGDRVALSIGGNLMCLIVTMVGVDDIPKLADLGLEMIGLI